MALCVSGFVSGSEIAFFSLNAKQREKLEEHAWGRQALQLLAKPERLLATILIANNLVNVTIVILVNYALGPVFEHMDAVLSFILQTIIITFVILRTTRPSWWAIRNRYDGCALPCRDSG